jgi:hypothetical protein
MAEGEREDPLRRLGERLEQASDAAERLIAQAAEEAAARIQSAAKPPPSGWQTSEQTEEAVPSADLALILQAVRDLVPPELQQRLVEALRELLLAVRAMIDWYLARIEQRRTEPVQVQDIPVL